MNKNVVYTDRSNRSVDLLLKDISKFHHLSNDEEYSLWQRMQHGDQAARSQLINCNMRYVVTLAKKYLWSGISLEDLILTGAVGLTLAADRFDATRGYRFLSYAVWWIDAELKKAVTEHWPHQLMSSLDAPLDAFEESDSEKLLDLIPADVETPDWALTSLSEMSAAKQLVRQHFFDGAASLFEDVVFMHDRALTLQSIARKHGITVERARELLHQIKAMLKQHYHHSYHLAA